VAALSAAALGGLAWQLLAQDRDLAVRRQQIELDARADALVASLQQALTRLEPLIGEASSAAQPPRPLPDGVVALSMTRDGAVISPTNALLYVPDATRADATGPDPFAEAERLEFANPPNPAAARAIYAGLAASRDPSLRAGALMRLGRVHRKLGAWDPALEAYAALGTLDPAWVEGLPSGLAARIGRMDTFEGAGQPQPRDDEARKLLADLRGVRWPVTKTLYQTYAGLARRPLADAPADDQDAVARADAGLWLWEQRTSEGPIARRLLSLPSGVALVVWSATASQLDALVVSASFLTALANESVGSHAAWAISTPDGERAIGQARPNGTIEAVRTAVASGLPWTLHVFPAEAPVASLPARRIQLLLVLGLVSVVLAGGWWLTFRALSRERRVAALQSDFVSAVSHEFRSPLTALSHAADLLVNDRLTSDALRRQTYEVLDRDTSRLRTLVEDLLESGRLEAGGATFSFVDTDVAALVRDTVEELQARVGHRGYVVSCEDEADAVIASVDREALTRALGNLLDNAVKYSPDDRRIDVSVGRDGSHVSIGVRDHGIGIPADEHRTIFDRFTRGAESKARRIPGTGIGLAMVSQIVRAHGGDVTVSSSPGRGSVFTIRVPTTRRESGDVRPSAALW
jgi:anti-sigma regulatory factor (Ser/Thr protein kinase)